MSRTAHADVAVVGGGIIGLASALEVAGRGLRTVLVDARRQGESSPAAAGMLAPGMERVTGAAHDFATASRDAYPAWVAELEARTGATIPLNQLGILELLPPHSAPPSLSSPGARLLTNRELSALEPALAHAPGALFHERDGAVESIALLGALRTVAAASSSVRIVPALAMALEHGHSHDPHHIALRLSDGSRIVAGRIVLAAGAWVTALGGLPRTLPVEPVRGQMLALDTAPFRHVVAGPGAYAVPRAGGTTAVGATMERVGFDSAITPEGQAALERGAALLAPALASAPVLARWSGLRPVTPDLLPIIGCDPEIPSLIYACGHSRNGILMAPATARCVAALAAGDDVPYSLSAFRPDRFALH